MAGGGKPRVALVVTLAEVGGAQSYVRDLLPALVDEFEVLVAAHGPGPVRSAAHDAGVAYAELRHVRRDPHPWRDARGLAELTGLLRRFRPRLVHLNSSKAGVLGRLAAVPAQVPLRVFTAHGWAFKAPHGRAASLYRWADRAVRPLTTAVVCVSEEERRAGIAAGTCTPERTIVIPNAVSVDVPVASHAHRDGPLRLVTAGRLAAPKDVGLLLEALAAVPEATLDVLGDGPLRPGLERAARTLAPGRARFRGEVEDVPARLAEADAFVLASRSEGMPISVLEAMAAGLPVVASAVGGVPEVVEDGATGLLVPPGDVRAAADAIRTLADAETRARLGAAGRERAVARFSLPAWRAAHVELYRRLLAGGPAVPPTL